MLQCKGRKIRLCFSSGSIVTNLPANAGDVGSMLESGRSPEEEMATHSSILAWEIPRTEELGGLQSLSGKELHMTGN